MNFLNWATKNMTKRTTMKIDTAVISNPTSARGRELAAEILAQIKADPESHDQELWGWATACGTTMCIAGWATYLAGKSHFLVDEFARAHYGVEEAHLSPIRSDNEYKFIEDIAGTLLELSAEDALDLFYTEDNKVALAALEMYVETGSIDWEELKK